MRSNRPIPSNSIFTRYLLQIAFTDVERQFEEYNESSRARTKDFTS